MTKKARTLSVYLSLAVMPLGLVGLAVANHTSVTNRPGEAVAAQESDAAYRDGVFLGQFDGKAGRKVPPSVGRWNSEEDRAAFKAGYQRGYSEALAAKLTK